MIDDKDLSEIIGDVKLHNVRIGFGSAESLESEGYELIDPEKLDAAREMLIDRATDIPDREGLADAITSAQASGTPMGVIVDPFRFVHGYQAPFVHETILAAKEATPEGFDFTAHRKKGVTTHDKALGMAYWREVKNVPAGLSFYALEAGDPLVCFKLAKEQVEDLEFAEWVGFRREYCVLPYHHFEIVIEGGLARLGAYGEAWGEMYSKNPDEWERLRVNLANSGGIERLLVSEAPDGFVVTEFLSTEHPQTHAVRKLHNTMRVDLERGVVRWEWSGTQGDIRSRNPWWDFTKPQKIDSCVTARAIVGFLLMLNHREVVEMVAPVQPNRAARRQALREGQIVRENHDIYIPRQIYRYVRDGTRGLHMRTRSPHWVRKHVRHLSCKHCGTAFVRFRYVPCIDDQHEHESRRIVPVRLQHRNGQPSTPPPTYDARALDPFLEGA